MNLSENPIDVCRLTRIAAVRRNRAEHSTEVSYSLRSATGGRTFYFLLNFFIGQYFKAVNLDRIEKKSSVRGASAAARSFRNGAATAMVPSGICC